MTGLPGAPTLEALLLISAVLWPVDFIAGLALGRSSGRPVPWWSYLVVFLLLGGLVGCVFLLLGNALGRRLAERNPARVAARPPAPAPWRPHGAPTPATWDAPASRSGPPAAGEPGSGLPGPSLGQPGGSVQAPVTPPVVGHPPTAPPSDGRVGWHPWPHDPRRRSFWDGNRWSATAVFEAGAWRTE